MIVAIEGIDAAGKATQSRLLAERLGGEVISLPDYSTPTGRAIRANLRSEWAAHKQWTDAPSICERSPEINAHVLQCLMSVNRLEVLPRINYLKAAGRPIVLDRWWASAMVYGSIDGLDPQWTKSIQIGLPAPDVWMLLDVPVEEAKRRRPEHRDRYEAQKGLMSRARDEYLRLFWPGLTHPGYGEWLIVDGMGTVDNVARRVWSAYATQALK